MKLPKTFIGWTNIKWLIKEFIAMYSNTNSYFSKKRFESSMAFLGAMGLVLTHAYYSRATITNSEIIADAVLLFAVAGYTVNQIQSEKKPITPPSQDESLAEKKPNKDDDLVA